MAFRKWAVLAALIAAATPSLAFDIKDAGPTTMFFISIPLDNSGTRRDREWGYGIQLQGKREYQAVNIDSKMLNFLPAGGLEAKWILAGIVAAGAAVAVAGKDKSTTSSLQTQQTQHQQTVAAQNPPAACPTPVANPCN